MSRRTYFHYLPLVFVASLLLIPTVQALTLPTQVNSGLISSTVNCSGVFTWCVTTETISGTQEYSASNSTGCFFGYCGAANTNAGGASGEIANSVINKVWALGGKSELGCGTFTVSAELNYTSNSLIKGCGRGSTIIKLADSTSFPVNSMGIVQPKGYGNAVPTSGYFASNVTIEDLTINGNYQNEGSAIYEDIVMLYVKDGTLNNIQTINASEVGINAGGNSTQSVVISNSYMEYNKVDGFQGVNAILIGDYSEYNHGNGYNFVSSTLTPSHSVGSAVASFAFNNSAAGFATTPQTGSDYPVVLSGDTSMYNEYGFFIEMAQTSLTGSTAKYNEADGVFIAADNTTVNSNFISDNNQQPSIGTYNLHSGIGILGKRYNLMIDGNHVFDDQAIKTQSYGINLYGYSAGANNSIINNQLYSTGIAINGITGATDYYVNGNAGFLTENSGSASLSASTSVVVNHGLAEAPTSVIATASSSSCGAVSVGSFTSTQFTVTVNNSCTATIYWTATYEP